MKGRIKNRKKSKYAALFFSDYAYPAKDFAKKDEGGK